MITQFSGFVNTFPNIFLFFFAAREIFLLFPRIFHCIRIILHLHIPFAQTQEQPAEGTGMKRDKGIKVTSAAVDRFVCGQKNGNQHGDRGKTPDAEQGGRPQPKHAQQFEGIAEFMVLLGSLEAKLKQ